MKKILFILVAVIGFGFAAIAQDVIVTTEGKKIESKVTEVNENDIRYKLFDNPSGPVYFLKKSDIAAILYESGHVDVFKMPQPQLYNNLYNPYTKVDLKNAKNLRNSGIVLFSSGMAFTYPIGLSLIFAPSRHSYDYYGDYYDYDKIVSGICFTGIGSALTLSGIIMWAVGQSQMNTINRFNPNGFSLFENEKVQFNLAVGGNSVGLKLNF